MWKLIDPYSLAAGLFTQAQSTVLGFRSGDDNPTEALNGREVEG